VIFGMGIGLGIKLAAGAAILAVVGGLYWRLDVVAAQRDAAKALAARFEAANAELSQVIEDQARTHTRTLHELEQVSRQRENVRTVVRYIREEARDAEDGPVADVLRIGLDRLRSRNQVRGPGEADQADDPAATD